MHGGSLSKFAGKSYIMQVRASLSEASETRLTHGFDSCKSVDEVARWVTGIKMIRIYNSDASRHGSTIIHTVGYHTADRLLLQRGFMLHRYSGNENYWLRFISDNGTLVFADGCN